MFKKDKNVFFSVSIFEKHMGEKQLLLLHNTSIISILQQTHSRSDYYLSNQISLLPQIGACVYKHKFLESKGRTNPGRNSLSPYFYVPFVNRKLCSNAG